MSEIQKYIEENLLQTQRLVSFEYELPYKTRKSSQVKVLLFFVNNKIPDFFFLRSRVS